LDSAHYSPRVEKELVWLSGAQSSFAGAEEICQRIGHVAVWDSSIWRRKERWGERIQQMEEAQREQANTLANAHTFRQQVTGATQCQGVAMDGTMVHIRQEGWKELKVGACFDVVASLTWDPTRKEWEEMPHAVHNHYVAHLGGPEEFGQLVWARAQQRGWEWARDKEVVGDGAVWVWRVAQTHFYDGCQIVDWYHALEHLSDVAELLYGEETPAAQRWYRSAETALYQGHAERIALEVERAADGHPDTTAEALRREAGYLARDQRRMQYMERREEGYVIGSGMVESGGKQFKSRFCGPGMRWNREGIERLIPIRAAIMSDCFDATWQAARNSPQN
jgi:hypothetical protein